MDKPLFTRRRFIFLAGAGLAGGAAASWLVQGSSNRAVGPESAPAPRSNAHPLPNLQLVQRTGWALGTEIRMQALHPSAETARAGLDAAFVELERIEEVMSLYRPQSQLCRLNREGFLRDPDPRLVSVLRGAQELARRSEGAFDATVQPLWELYWSAKEAGRLPGEAEIDRVRARVSWKRLSVSDQEIRLEGGDGLRGAVTLNGIAQGFALDRALEALRGLGIQHALIDTGEAGALGERADGTPWVAGIRNPRREEAVVALARLEGRCLATSGDYETTFSSDYLNHHIFDPHTGRSPRVFSSVSVLASSGTDADGLSTAVFVAGAERGLRLIEETPGAEAFLVFKDGRTQATPGFPRM